jgi:hypothetical protein
VESGRIVQADLLMETDWMASHLPLALDLSKSFVLAFAPPPERARFEAIAGALQRLADPACAREMAGKDPAESELAGCVLAFMGRGRGTAAGEFASLRFASSTHAGKRQLEIGYVLH